ncbi:hypothetical protein ACVDG3_01975 [Meridianimarinicoccus sp. RP-17]|uniref:hypothetical protein n=1 Tax=Meridianimarinicoccus zhengii TaxID=2056810 RepID=UPI000DAE9611|nr:hypothetical protein [Phycocomes zhengii]
MTHRSPFAAAVALCAALALPGAVGAASLSPLDNLGPGAAVPGLDEVPGLPATPGAKPVLAGPAPFKFVDDTGLNADPLRGVLPENQWAVPQAAQNGLIRRR